MPPFPRVLAFVVLALSASGLLAAPPVSGPFGEPRRLDLDPRANGAGLRADLRPRALAAGDFDEDGTPDLVIAFSAPGGGTVALLPGDPDALYPSEPGARRRRAAGRLDERAVAPFRKPAVVLELRVPAEFLGSGDFDNDGHLDLIVAAEGSRTLLLHAGNGRGGFSGPAERRLPGGLSRMIAGEINHPDALADIVAAVEIDGRTEILVFEGPEGAWTAEPETVRRGGPITTLALGDLDGDVDGDLVLGVEGGMEVVHGRDRKLSLGSADRAMVAGPVVDRHPLGFTPLRAAIGRFGENLAASLALLGDDGSLRLAAAGSMRSPRLAGNGRSDRVLVRMAGAGTGDTLLSLEQNGAMLHALGAGRNSVEATVSLTGEPVDALPLRLGPEAAASLVLLNDSGGALLSILPPAAPMTYLVTSIADFGPGSLRQAILDANANPGLDTITFNITPSALLTISPVTPLPDITDPVTIDGTTQPGYPGTPIVEIDGSGNLPPGTNGLVVRRGSSVVRGLAIRGFSGSAVALDGAGHNIVEGNFLGLDSTGTNPIGNQDSGVVIRDSHLNTIGGTAPPARNVISGNGQAGVAIRGPSTFEAEYASQGASVAICDLCTVSIPVVVPDERLIADVNVRVSLTHTFDGDLVLTLVAPDATRIVLSRNHGGSGDDYSSTLFDDGAATPIAAGIAPFSGSYVPDEPLSLLNGRSQVGTWLLEVADTAGGDVGAFHGWSMTTEGETIYGNVVLGNLIGTDVTGTIGLGNTRGVVIDQSPQNTVGGTVPGARNVIVGGREQFSGHGVEITGFGAFNALRNAIQGNYIGTDITGTIRIPNLGYGIHVSHADATQIGGTASGARNLVSGNGQGGVLTQGGAFVRIQANTIGPDVTGTIPLSQDVGPGVTLGHATSHSIVGGSVVAARNQVSGNFVGIFTEGFAPSTFSNAILGNYVGTDPSGTLAVRNSGHGILVNSPLVQVGGPAAGEGNLSSGNNTQSGTSGIAVWPDCEGCTVQGNILGLDATGTVPLGNNRGLLINGGSYSLFGGINPGEANLIAGNDSHGVWIHDPMTGSFPDQTFSSDGVKPIPDLATITSVLATTNLNTDLLVTLKVHVDLFHTFDADLVLTLIAPNGTRIPLANRRGGGGDDFLSTLFDDDAAVAIASGAPPFSGSFRPEEPLSTLSGLSASGTWTLEIADVAAGDSGFFLGWSIEFDYIRVHKNGYQSRLVGNFIGTDAAGATGLGNGGDGIFGELSSVLQIGAPGAGNIIAGNAGHGILMNANFCAANVIQSNLIGLKPDGVTPLGNGGDGIVASGPVGLIGGPGAAFANHIAWNGGAGVNVSPSASLRQTTVRVNSIHDNGGLGIDLAPIGVNLNDPGDGDTGANMMQNTPAIASVAPGFMNSVLISGSLASRPDSKYVIDVYGSPQGDPSGSGEGRVWLGSGTFNSDSSGNVSWTVLTQTTGVGLVSATATDFAGNTSEFSGLMATPQEASAAKTMQVAIGPANSVQITYTPACGATDHVLYWGQAGAGGLAPGGMNWTSAACGLGISGSAGILLGNPPVGQMFYFAIVGQNGSVEGSYGQSSTGAEEPEAIFPAICARPQFLGGACN